MTLLTWSFDAFLTGFFFVCSYYYYYDSGIILAGFLVALTCVLTSYSLYYSLDDYFFFLAMTGFWTGDFAF
jgi:hypothetical protein